MAYKTLLLLKPAGENTTLQLGNVETRRAEQSECSLHLPQEIMEEILSRLPVKSLLKFRCVSKSWRFLIDSERFIKAHLQNSRKNTDFPQHRVILEYGGLRQCFVQSLLNGPSFDPIKVPWKRVDVLGCCNGLVCLLEKSKYFILWNPSTRISKKLPEIDSVTNDTALVRNYGFAWFESSGEYKVFAVVSVFLPGAAKELQGKVYSSKTNSWKTVGHEDLYFEVETGKFLGGKLHWIMEYGHDIVSFDLKSEVFGMIELPFERGQCYRLLGVLGGYLCALLYKDDWTRDIDVWVMKEYGVKESWQKLEPPFPAPFVVGSDGEILLFFGTTFLVYYPKDNMFEYPNLDELDISSEARLCIETLVSPIFITEQSLINRID